MKNFARFIPIWGLALMLTACQSPHPSVRIEPIPAQTSMPEALTPPTAPPLESETNPNDVANDPVNTDPAAQTLRQTQNLINQFALKQQASFLACANSALLDCQSQTAAQVALKDKKPETCENIMDKNQADVCKNQLWQQLAQLEARPNLCDNIEAADQRQRCTDQALLKQAQTESQPTLCEGITTPDQADNCRNQVLSDQALTALDPTICEQISAYNYRYQNVTDPETGEITGEELVRETAPESENYPRQDCLSQVTNAIEVAAEAAAETEALGTEPEESEAPTE